MAKIELDGFDDFIDELEKIADIATVNNIAKRCINKASPTLVKSIRGTIKAKTKGNGDLELSIESTQAKTNSYGVFSASRPTGKDRRGVRNGAKLAYLEYGTSHSDPNPIISPAVASVRSEVINIMSEEFDSSLKEMGLG